MSIDAKLGNPEAFIGIIELIAERRGIARIRCPTCGFDRFHPFSCRSSLSCPSCVQTRTLLFGEYLSEDLLLRLPHRQFVWAIS